MVTRTTQKKKRKKPASLLRLVRKKRLPSTIIRKDDDDDDDELESTTTITTTNGRLRTFFMILVFVATFMNIGLHHYNTSSSTSTHDHDYDYDIMWSSNNGDRNSELRVVEIDLPSIIINNNTNSSFVEQQPTKPKSTTRKSKSNTKILGFADMNYKDIAFKWYQELTELGYTEHIVVAYDVPTEQYFQHNNMRYDTIHDHTNPDDDQQLFQNNHTFPTSITIDQCKNTYDNRWKREAQQNQIYKRRLFGSRWNYVLRQLQLGYNVLLTDV
eukprot:CAMPEP_0171055640 /NCGR_PEP_ID=MMETSP0736-20130129/55894_1 /TAXON_ID=186038 /ORGANISM="Fragilariopsis kerguelensis, Strain L26-C5" /LENGTH=270 /DNA_ID=CAMNT_0011510197 /DNA_START=27 /DNA_END=835 /DNA_ORIENTATION=-